MRKMENYCYQCVLMILVFVFVLGGCDIPLSAYLPYKNFNWSQQQIYDYTSRADAYYRLETNAYLLIIHSKGTGQLVGTDEFVLLCIDKKEPQRLINGIALRTLAIFKESGQVVMYGPVLKDGLRISKKANKLEHVEYEGMIPITWLQTENEEERWLRFEVNPQENPEHIESLIEQLKPLLENIYQDGKSVDFLEMCINLARSSV